MSTKGSLYYRESEKEHGAYVHIYTEYHDENLAPYLEIHCQTCNVGVRVPLAPHLAKSLIEEFLVEGEE